MQGEHGGGKRWKWEGGWLCVSRGPPCELCSREPGHWGEVVRACLKQYTQGFSQSSHTQCARSMSLSQRSPATHQQIHSDAGKNAHVSSHTHTQRQQTNTDALAKHTGCLKYNQSSQAGPCGTVHRQANSLACCLYIHGDILNSYQCKERLSTGGICKVNMQEGRGTRRLESMCKQI